MSAVGVSSWGVIIQCRWLYCTLWLNRAYNTEFTDSIESVWLQRQVETILRQSQVTLMCSEIAIYLQNGKEKHMICTQCGAAGLYKYIMCHICRNNHICMGKASLFQRFLIIKRITLEFRKVIICNHLTCIFFPNSFKFICFVPVYFVASWMLLFDEFQLVLVAFRFHYNPFIVFKGNRLHV